MSIQAELSIITPTLNERENIGALLSALEHALEGLEWELIVVDDDSNDGTAEIASQLALTQRRLRCLRRIGQRGLSGAAIEGFRAASAPYIALIDADLQHDETLLPSMLQKLKHDDCDIVVASRYAKGGSASGLSGKDRTLFSCLGTLLAKHVLRTRVSDPLSGFFTMRREVFEKTARRLSGKGFKILADIIASSEAPLRIAELPYKFRARNAGKSKFNIAVQLDFLVLLLNKIMFSVFRPLHRPR